MRHCTEEFSVFRCIDQLEYDPVFYPFIIQDLLAVPRPFLFDALIEQHDLIDDLLNFSPVFIILIIFFQIDSGGNIDPRRLNHNACTLRSVIFLGCIQPCLNTSCHPLIHLFLYRACKCPVIHSSPFLNAVHDKLDEKAGTICTS